MVWFVAAAGAEEKCSCYGKGCKAHEAEVRADYHISAVSELFDSSSWSQLLPLVEGSQHYLKSTRLLFVKGTTKNKARKKRNDQIHKKKKKIWQQNSSAPGRFMSSLTPFLQHFGVGTHVEISHFYTRECTLRCKGIRWKNRRIIAVLPIRAYVLGWEAGSQIL